MIVAISWEDKVLNDSQTAGIPTRAATAAGTATAETAAAETAAARSAAKAAADTQASATILAAVLASLDDDKAEDVVQVDLRGKTTVADFMVIASGRSTRQVAAISEKLMDRLRDGAGVRARAEGLEVSDWVLVDAGDVIVHIFRPEVRDFYQLEKMWLPQGDAVKRLAGAA